MIKKLLLALSSRGLFDAIRRTFFSIDRTVSDFLSLNCGDVVGLDFDFLAGCLWFFSRASPCSQVVLLDTRGGPKSALLVLIEKPLRDLALVQLCRRATSLLCRVSLYRLSCRWLGTLQLVEEVKQRMIRTVFLQLQISHFRILESQILELREELAVSHLVQDRLLPHDLCYCFERVELEFVLIRNLFFSDDQGIFGQKDVLSFVILLGLEELLDDLFIHAAGPSLAVSFEQRLRINYLRILKESGVEILTLP